MCKIRLILLSFVLSTSFVFSTEFTISSYNCGGLSNHYDYLRAASMQKLMQERYIAEPENMAQNERIQKLALKILFSQDLEEKTSAQREWDQKNYQEIIKHLVVAPTEPDSLNARWNQKADNMITSYKIRPVVIHDDEVNQLLKEHVQDLIRDGKAETFELLQEARAIMAKRIFSHHLKFDIICLQEADYLDISMFPEHYEIFFADTAHSKNGIAWNKERFELIDTIGDIMGRAFAVKLIEKESGKSILVASGHISGCNPYSIQADLKSGISDAEKGDSEIRKIIEIFDVQDSDIMIVGMDSNVTSLHPRLSILKEAGYRLDYDNYLESTCTNPYQVLNTRIDWIFLKSKDSASITNIPVLDVGLNSIQTNISDHKPVAAKVKIF
ncbi:MAG TPA: endonuclease/exonuclease/phosphatase family protein [Waddliaceae bacterium]